MSYTPEFSNQRKDARVSLELPVRISIGSQLTLQGLLKDLSLKSAFIRIKYSVYVQANDEVGFSISSAPEKADDHIYGKACISRIVPGEGFAIYFTHMEDTATKRLKKIMTP